MADMLDNTEDILSPKAQQDLLRERWEAYERKTRIGNLFAGAFEQGIIGMFGQIRKRQETVTSTFPPSEIPGLCRTCRNATAYQQEWRQPEVLCRVTSQYMPTTITKCSSYDSTEEKKEKPIDYAEYEKLALVVGPAEGAWARKRAAMEGKPVNPSDKELSEWEKNEKERRGYR